MGSKAVIISQSRNNWNAGARTDGVKCRTHMAEGQGIGVLPAKGIRGYNHRKILRI